MQHLHPEVEVLTFLDATQLLLNTLELFAEQVPEQVDNLDEAAGNGQLLGDEAEVGVSPGLRAAKQSAVDVFHAEVAWHRLFLRRVNFLPIIKELPTLL